MMVSTVQPKRESQVGYLRVRSFSKRLRFFNPTLVAVSPSFYFPLIMYFNYLIMFGFSAISADRRQVAPRLSLTNVVALNYLLWSEIFVSEEKQLRAVHLILDFDPISKIFQEVGHAIRAGGHRINRIDVSKLDFLARDNLPPVVLPVY